MVIRVAWCLCFLMACVKPQSPGSLSGTPNPTESESSESLQLEPEIPLEVYVNQGADLIRAGDGASLRQAVELLESKVQQYPEYAPFRLNLGVAYERLGRMDAARTAFQGTINIDDELPQAWLYLARIEEQRGRVSAAVSIYRNGLRHVPASVDLVLGLVGAYLGNDQNELAATEAKKALGNHANNLELYNALALAHFAQKEFILAKFVYQKALASVEGADAHGGIQTNLGWTYYQLGEKGPAVFRLKKAQELDPDLVTTLVYLARIYFEDHNYGDAVPLLKRAAQLDSNNSGVQLNLGIALRGIGRLEEAEQAYRRALEIDPKNPDAHFNLGVLKGDYLKDYSGAVKAFETYVSAGGSNKELALQHVSDIKKEERRAIKRQKAEEERKKREVERDARARLLEAAENNKSAEASPVVGESSGAGVWGAINVDVSGDVVAPSGDVQAENEGNSSERLPPTGTVEVEKTEEPEASGTEEDKETGEDNATPWKAGESP